MTEGFAYATGTSAEVVIRSAAIGSWPAPAGRNRSGAGRKGPPEALL
jgi:hypothetical protein